MLFIMLCTMLYTEQLLRSLFGGLVLNNHDTTFAAANMLLYQARSQILVMVLLFKH